MKKLLNYTSIQKNTGCQILDIGYEFGFVPLSSSKRDAESDGASSEFDRPYLSTYSGDAV